MHEQVCSNDRKCSARSASTWTKIPRQETGADKWVRGAIVFDADHCLESGSLIVKCRLARSSRVGVEILSSIRTIPTSAHTPLRMLRKRMEIEKSSIPTAANAQLGLQLQPFDPKKIGYPTTRRRLSVHVWLKSLHDLESLGDPRICANLQRGKGSSGPGTADLSPSIHSYSLLLPSPKLHLDHPTLFQ